MSQTDRAEERVEEPAIAPEDVTWLDSMLAEYHDLLEYLRDH